MEESVAVIGGAGHVGLPLAISLAISGLKTTIYDLNETAIEDIAKGYFPFKENFGEEKLREALDSGNLSVTANPENLSRVTAVVNIIGTPVDDHLNPDPDAIRKSLQELKDHLRDGQLLILRSTVFPGVTSSVEKLLAEFHLKIDVVAAPERITEGNAFIELPMIPQIIGARSEAVFRRTQNLFGSFVKECVVSTPEEAELAKLFSNSWRYIRFAAANELYGIAIQAGQNFDSIRKLMAHKYPRAEDFPTPGFAAGPCLPKDSLQLMAYSRQASVLNSAAYSVNENLPNIVVKKISSEINLSHKTVGILGMAFKPGSDDARSSLSYKLRKLLTFECKKVLCSDPYVTDQRFTSMEQVLEESDVIIIAIDHHDYRQIESKKAIYKVWNL
jgi:UDP-N-acetyl-D-mannosaminuronic acid dehydrogenase